MTPIPTELRPLLERAIDVIEDGAHLKEHWDFAEELRAMLETPPADAADMGGQAGEEVEVVGYWTEDGLHWTEESAAHGSKAYQSMMTVAQHRRINAQHRQQAGKLAEALRKIHFRADCFVEDDMDMRVPSIEAIVRIAGEALAAWDVKP